MRLTTTKRAAYIHCQLVRLLSEAANAGSWEGAQVRPSVGRFGKGRVGSFLERKIRWARAAIRLAEPTSASLTLPQSHLCHLRYTINLPYLETINIIIPAASWATFRLTIVDFSLRHTVSRMMRGFKFPRTNCGRTSGPSHFLKMQRDSDNRTGPPAYLSYAPQFWFT